LKVRTGTILTLVIKQKFHATLVPFNKLSREGGAALANLIYIATTYFFLFNFLLCKSTPHPTRQRSEPGTIIFASDPSCTDDSVITQYVFGPAELRFRYPVFNSSATNVTCY
jgi:hypothetical protein